MIAERLSWPYAKNNSLCSAEAMQSKAHRRGHLPLELVGEGAQRGVQLRIEGARERLHVGGRRRPEPVVQLQQCRFVFNNIELVTM